MVDGSRKCLSANALDDASNGQAELVSFASVPTMEQDATFKKQKPCSKGKGKKRL